MLDEERQSFYRKSLQAVKATSPGAFVVVLGLGSVLPMLLAAADFQGLLLESSEKLAELAQQLLTSNKREKFKVAVVKALDDAWVGWSHLFMQIVWCLIFMAWFCSWLAMIRLPL